MYRSTALPAQMLACMHACINKAVKLVFTEDPKNPNIPNSTHGEIKTLFNQPFIHLYFRDVVSSVVLDSHTDVDNTLNYIVY